MDQYAAPTEQPPGKPEMSTASPSRSFGWSPATLLVGIVALSVAVLFHLSESPKPEAESAAIEPAETEVDAGRGIHFRWKGIDFHFRGDIDSPKEPEKVVAPSQPDESFDQHRAVRMAAAAIALLGLALGPFAFWRESAYALAGPGMMFCFLGLTWQYVIAGIAAGVAIAVLLLLLSAFSSVA